MSSRSTVVATVIMIVAAVLLSLAVYPRLPEQVASHWDSADQVNGTMPRIV